MTTTTHNLAALRAAILAEPGDDTVRLAFADALDEHGGEMEGKWAELIRVGVELTRLGPKHTEFGFDKDLGSSQLRAAGPDYWVFTDIDENVTVGDRVDVRGGTLFGKTKTRHGLVVTKREDRGSEGIEFTVKRDEYSGKWKGETLAARESALVAELEPWLRRGARCERCRGKGRIDIRLSANRAWLNPIGDPLKNRRRQNKATCHTCRGTGWSGSLAEKTGLFQSDDFTNLRVDWCIPVRLARGFYGEVTLSLDDIRTEERCREVLGPVLREWPVESVMVEGREVRMADGPHWFANHNERDSITDISGLHKLPAWLAERLPDAERKLDYHGLGYLQRYYYYPSRDLAMRALGEAVRSTITVPAFLASAPK